MAHVDLRSTPTREVAVKVPGFDVLTCGHAVSVKELRQDGRTARRIYARYRRCVRCAMDAPPQYTISATKIAALSARGSKEGAR